MTQENFKDNVVTLLTNRPKSVRSQRSAGPQGTRMFETANLEWIRSRSVKPSTADIRQPNLLGINLPFMGQRFALKAGTNTIGRADNNNIVLNESGVSSTHAKIVYENGGWRVMNLLSTNGTFVNGKKHTLSPLKPGDRIRFGRVEFLFDYNENALPLTKAPADVKITASQRLHWRSAAIIALLAMATVSVLFILL